MAAERDELRISGSGDGPVTFDVWAKPNARKSAVTGVRDGALEVRLAAAPVDGAANEELVTFLAGRLGVPRGRVRLVRGTSSRAKRVQIDGLRVEEVRARLASL